MKKNNHIKVFVKKRRFRILINLTSPISWQTFAISFPRSSSPYFFAYSHMTHCLKRGVELAFDFSKGSGRNLIGVLFSEVKLIIEGEFNFQASRKHCGMHIVVNFGPELVDGLLVEFDFVDFIHVVSAVLSD
jgi:hypothetical protein